MYNSLDVLNGIGNGSRIKNLNFNEENNSLSFTLTSSLTNGSVCRVVPRKDTGEIDIEVEGFSAFNIEPDEAVFVLANVRKFALQAAASYAEQVSVDAAFDAILETVKAWRS